MKNLIIILSLLGGNAFAASSLDDLLGKIKTESVLDHKENKARESEFISKRDHQKKLLAQAKAELNQLNSVSAKLGKDFEKQEKTLTELEGRLNIAMGTLGEMFGVVRQVAGDLRGQLQNSVISAQIGGRIPFTDELTEKKKLPNVEKLEQLWFELQREMTESGKVAKFKTQVTLPNGRKEDRQITRVGSFNLVSDGNYLTYQPTTGQVTQLARQPEGRFTRLVDDLETSQSGFTAFGLDPSRGSILSMLVQAPSLIERVQQGGLVGYVILSILLIGLGITAERFVFLRKENEAVKKQMTSGTPDQGNSLGRLLATFETVKARDSETIELKLEESILKSTPKLTRGLPTIKILAAIAPLLGLLGTVTGMIVTFQSITLFGTGDPRLMAGGISQALVTTVLGLVCAIPLLLLHNFVSSKSKEVVQILEEQGAGLVAQRSEASE